MTTAPQRPPDIVAVLPGPRKRPWTVHAYYADSPDPKAWQRAEDALVRFLLPIVQDIMKEDGNEHADAVPDIRGQAGAVVDVHGLRAGVGPGGSAVPAAAALPLPDRLCRA